MALADRFTDTPSTTAPALAQPQAIPAAASPFFIFAQPTPAPGTAAPAARHMPQLALENPYHPTLYNPEDPAAYGFDLEFTPELSAADWETFCSSSPCPSCGQHETWTDTKNVKHCRTCEPIPPRVLNFYNRGQQLRRNHARFNPIDELATERRRLRDEQRAREQTERDAILRAADMHDNIGDDNDRDDPDAGEEV